MRGTRAASESTTGTPGASESPAARAGRPPRARSGTFSGVSSGMSLNRAFADSETAHAAAHSSSKPCITVPGPIMSTELWN